MQTRRADAPPSMKQRLLHAVAAALILILAACGTDASSPSDSTEAVPDGGETSETTDTGDETTPARAADLPPACDLLMTDEVEALVGATVEVNESDEANCFWRPAEGVEAVFVLVSLVPLSRQDCLDFHAALGTTETFDYEAASDTGVPGFWQYNQNLAGEYIGTYELCTPQVNVGVRVGSAEDAPADEAGQRAIADQLVPLVLGRLAEALGS